MSKLSAEEVVLRKKAVFDGMSERRQKYILKKGYDRWDPFEEPKDPIDIRKDKTKRTTQMLMREFLQSRPGEAQNNSYNRGVLEIALGLVNNEDRFRGMFEFSCWYQEILKQETSVDDTVDPVSDET